jgi:SlyX protein
MQNGEEKFEQRMTVLEEKLEYQEYTMEKLNEVILSQQNQLDKLEENLVLLREKLATTLHRDDRLGE